MVDIQQIEHLLNKHLDINGPYKIDNQSGIVDVTGSVRLLNTHVNKLPVKFGKVTRNFSCGNRNLTSLEGAPHWVGGSFFCDNNALKSLEYAPGHVEVDFVCESNLLTDLTHMPAFVGAAFWCYDNPLHSLNGFDAHVHVGGEFWCTYTSDLPLLRCLQVTGLITLSDHTVIAPPPVSDILDKYQPLGKKGMLNCANELKQAGYSRNARW
jgi:hypothetical protein